MTSSIRGPGILFVRSRIAQSAKDILDETTFLKWYDDEHITEVVSTSGIKSGFRYIDTKKTSPCGNSDNPKPFLAFYPMNDLAFTLGEEFRKIGFKSANLPGTGIVYDLADLDVSYLGLVDKGEGRGSQIGPPSYILTCGIRPKRSYPEFERKVNEVLERQRTLMATETGYTRSLMFGLQYARTNAQSRKLKGLPTTDEPSPEPSTRLLMVEFGSLPDADKLVELKEMGGEVDGEWEIFLWRFDRAHGDGRMFS